MKWMTTKKQTFLRNEPYACNKYLFYLDVETTATAVATSTNVGKVTTYSIKTTNLVAQETTTVMKTTENIQTTNGVKNATLEQTTSGSTQGLLL
jgi:hypothetical protein